MKRSVSDMTAEQSPVVESLRSDITELKRLLKEAKRSTGDTEEQLHEIMQAVDTVEPPKIQYKPQRKSKNPPCSLVVHCTDWHIGQTTNSQHIEEFGEFNYDIACKRIETLIQKVVDWTDLNRKSYTIDEVVVLGTGDWVSGGIHQELEMTNEFPVPVQAVKAGYLLGGLLTAFSSSFSTVRAEVITAGNHDRLTKKPQCEDGGLNSWGYVTAAVAKENVRTVNNVTVNIYPQTHKVVQVAGQRYLIAHGDGIQGTWGIPYYGIDRVKSREATSRMNMAEQYHFDKIIIGHFHSALNHEHWMIGGSLSGTTAYDHKAGRHSKPHQTAWLVHNTFDFGWARWWL
jgi:predicted phosphodiesterase